jgi:hypothetical protein
MTHPALKDDLSDIHKSIDVPLAPDQAFDLFTHGIATWWPGDTHSISAKDDQSPQDLTIEPQEGGQIWETTHDGTRTPWARITEWAPAERFSFNWHVGRPEDEATFVTVAFSRIDTGTRVDLIHGGFGNLVQNGATMAAGYRSGWDVVLGHCFAGKCRQTVAALETA